jgi:hypothetical protein
MPGGATYQYQGRTAPFGTAFRNVGITLVGVSVGVGVGDLRPSPRVVHVHVHVHVQVEEETPCGLAPGRTRSRVYARGRRLPGQRHLRRLA